jgi:hypothetical protein
MTSTGQARGTAGGGRALRIIVVAPELATLKGPVTGVHRLPLHLDSSAAATYDFADPHRRGLAYRTVLVEAGSERDLTAWLEQDALIEFWSDLYLPRPVRRAWEDRHPELARRGVGPDVPMA